MEAVHLKLGALSGVVARALLASYDLACDDTPLEGSRLVIEDVPIVIFCSNCQRRAGGEFHAVVLLCRCAARPRTDVVRGREIEVVALELSA